MPVVEAFFYQFQKFRTRIHSAVMSCQFKRIGVGTRIEPPFRGNRLNHVSVGDHVMIHRDCWIQVWLERSNSGTAELVIKSHAAIGMGATISAAQSVTIGEYVLLARNVYISDHGHAFYDVNDPIMLQGIATPKPVSIGNRSWLGQNVCVLPGASIGEHCVIGANSVVTTPIPDFSVAVGAPARVIKRYNKKKRTWERVETSDEVLLEMKSHSSS
jgi:acetyltransferase-like isoleucine patch superfamily enzyme